MQILRIVNLEPEAKTIKGLFYQNNFDISRKNVIYLSKLHSYHVKLLILAAITRVSTKIIHQNLD